MEIIIVGLTILVILIFGKPMRPDELVFFDQNGYPLSCGSVVFDDGSDMKRVFLDDEGKALEALPCNMAFVTSYDKDGVIVFSWVDDIGE